jgi:hypothetical protein
VKKTATAALAGLVLGILGARFVFVGSWLSLVPWGIAGIALGSWGTKQEAVVDGVIFGFVLSFVFMIAGYSGSFSLASRLPFFAIIGVFGAVCGLALGLIGFRIKARIAKGK